MVVHCNVIPTTTGVYAVTLRHEGCHEADMKLINKLLDKINYRFSCWSSFSCSSFQLTEIPIARTMMRTTEGTGCTAAALETKQLLQTSADQKERKTRRKRSIYRTNTGCTRRKTLNNTRADVRANTCAIKREDTARGSGIRVSRGHPLDCVCVFVCKRER